jgi:hypothetical protein
MDRKQVYKLIDGERKYQDEKWNANTTETGGKHDSPVEWSSFMQQYLREADAILAHNSRQVSYPKAMDIIRKVTAMGVAAMEQIDTPARAKVKK